MRPVIAAIIIVLAAGSVAAQADDERGQVDLRDLDLNEPALIVLMRNLLSPPSEMPGIGNCAAAAPVRRRRMAPAPISFRSMVLRPI